MTQLLNEDVFLCRLQESSFCFLQKVITSDGCLPALRGVTRLGKRLSLGFSCFALRILFMLRLWEELPYNQQERWISLIQSFQADHSDKKASYEENAFIDPALKEYHNFSRSRFPLIGWSKYHWLKKPARMMRGHSNTKCEVKKKGCNIWQRILHAETKQAITVLHDVSRDPKLPYKGFPHTPELMERYLNGLDWSRPWAAGAHFAVQSVFATTQASRFMEQAASDQLIKALCSYIEKRIDKPTGAYFTCHSEPSTSQLINGSMKVLTALDWLGVPPHAPENLIDTVLSSKPRQDGCHIVDAIYVLHQCLQETSYRKKECQLYCKSVLSLILEHYIEKDNGFSYFLNKSQTHYYGAPITHGYHSTADIHGTTLFSWAIILIQKILEKNRFQWRLPKP